MDVVIIANAWSAAADNPTGKHQLALQLVAQGHRVLWIEGSGMRRPRAGSGADRARIRTKLKAAARGFRRTPEGIRTVAPLILPLPANPVARAFNAVLYLLTALAGCLWLRFRRPVLLNFLPIVPLTEALWPWRTVYYCVDRWDSFSHYDAALMRRVDQACCRHADRVLATSRDLAERCTAVNPDTRLIGHGVDLDSFRAPLLTAASGAAVRPPDVPPGRIAGFFGLLSAWIDQELLLALAAACKAGRAGPDAHIVLIGPHDVDISRLRDVPRLHLVGPLPFRELPAWAACFEVGLIPFAVNDLTAAVNPVKLREMLAAGCPVVSTALPEVAALAATNPHITVAHDTATFIESVCHHLRTTPTPTDRLAISATMQAETWAAKADALIAALRE